MRLPWKVSITPALVALALMLAACNGSGEEGNPAPRDGVEAPGGGATTPSVPGSLPAEFVECMAVQGVEIDSPAQMFSMLHSGSSEAQQAFQACAQFFHSSGP